MKKDQKKAIIVPVLEIGESILGGKTIGEPSILTLVERKTRYAVTEKESRVCQSSSLRVYETLSH